MGKQEWQNKGEKPRWLIEIEKKLSIREVGIRTVAWNLLDHDRWMDGKVVAAAYSGSYEEIKKLVEFCEENNLQFNIIGGCEYYPERTFKVIIEPKESKA